MDEMIACPLLQEQVALCTLWNAQLGQTASGLPSQGVVNHNLTTIT